MAATDRRLIELLTDPDTATLTLAEAVRESQGGFGSYLPTSPDPAAGMLDTAPGAGPWPISSARGLPAGSTRTAIA